MSLPRFQYLAGNIVSRLFIILLTFSLLGASVPAAAFGPTRAMSLQPELIKQMAEQPEQEVAVIVQKTSAGNHLEALVEALGGKVTHDLHIINAFAATLPAKAVSTLATSNAVR